MKLAVIDTNVIIAAHITKHDDSATRRIIRAVSDGTVVPIVTPAILSEYAEVMSRTKFKIEPETVAATIRYFRERGKNVMPVVYSRLGCDILPTDNKLSIGMVGMLGASRSGNFAIQNAKLKIVF